MVSVLGEERYGDRIAALRTLLELREDPPELPSLSFIISHVGTLSMIGLGRCLKE